MMQDNMHSRSQRILISGANERGIDRRLVHEVVQQIACECPSAIALEHGDERITYRDLDRVSSALAAYLKSFGVGPEKLVGIYLKRSVNQVTAVLGVWRAGAAYLPIDPENPEARTRLLLEDSDISVLLTETNMIENTSIPIDEIDHVVLLDRWHPLSRPVSENEVMPDIFQDHLAYVMYTSGSTGKPKGVMITHRALSNHISWMQREYPIYKTDKVLLKAPFGFDASVWELCAPLMAGGTLVISQPDAHQNPDVLVETILRHRVTMLKLIPTLLRQLLGTGRLHECQTLKHIFCGAEPLTAKLVNDFTGTTSAVLHNLYGPTETAIDVTFWNCGGTHQQYDPPIGRPIDNVRAYILDDICGPLPPGMPGELFIAGESLGRGYWRRPDLTAERFLPDPSCDKAGERLYRTGDLARWNSSGDLEYLGRTDHQIKIHGVRVELNEIELTFANHPEIREAAVATEKSPQSDLKIVAGVVLNDGINPARVNLREYLGRHLPSYMIPGQISFLAYLPRLSNGKIDRYRLRQAIEISRGEQATYESPESEAEKALAEIWQEVLGVERVGIHDNFFELGGDSILSIQVVARSSRRDLRLTVRQVFESPTLAQLALLCEAASPRFETPTSPEDVSSVFDLTPIGVRFFEQELERPDHFNQSVLLQGAMDAAVLEVAVAKLVEHHDALRLRFERGPEGWRQSYAAAEEHRVVGHVDLSGLPEAGRRAELERLAEAAQSSLNLHEGPLLRVMQFDLGEQEQRLLAVVHHLAVDGVSWRILLEDLERLCEQASRGGPLEPGTGTASFRSWSEALSEYANSEEIKAEASFWISQQQAPVAPLAGRPSAEAGTVGQMRTAAVELTAEQTQLLLQGGPRKYRCQAQDLLLTALLLALRDWTGERRLQLDMEGHGREEVPGDLDVSRTVGWFTTVYPVVFELPPEEDLLAAVKSVRQQLRAVPRHGIGYGMLRYLSRDEQTRRTLAAAPGSPISFNYLGQFDQALGQSMRLAKESTGHGQHPANRSHYLLRCDFLVVDRCLSLNLSLGAAQVKPLAIEKLLQYLRRSCFKLIDSQVADLPARNLRDADSESGTLTSRIPDSAKHLTVSQTDAGKFLPTSPVIFCLSSYGDSPEFIFRDLALDLAPDISVHGLPVSDDPEFSYTKIAEAHAAEITMRQPSGPYILAGYSLGGLAAFEIANQLHKMGKEVASLILFETICPSLRIQIESLDDAELLERIMKLRDPSYRSDLQSALSLPLSERLDKLISVARARHVVPEEMTNLSVRAFLQLWRRRSRFGPYSYKGPIALCRTKSTAFLSNPFSNDYAALDEHAHSLGWRLACPANNLTVLDVPGEHANFLFRPHSREVARQLCSYLSCLNDQHDTRPY